MGPRRLATWAGVALLAVLVSAALAGSVPAVAQQSLPGSEPGQVRCLDGALRPSADCPEVAASVDVSLEGEALVVVVTNTGTAPWPGGPVAIEVPTPGLGIDQPEGREDATGRAGTAEWVTRAGTVVSRCVFEPVTMLAPQQSVSCRVLLLGLDDGDHQVWLTGFVGGLPGRSETFGEVAPPVGVVPVAESRSIAVRIGGGEASLVDQPPLADLDGEASAPDDDNDFRAGWIVALGALALAAAAAVWLWMFSRARADRDRTAL